MQAILEHFSVWLGRKRCVDVEMERPPSLTPLRRLLWLALLDIDLGMQTRIAEVRRLISSAQATVTSTLGGDNAHDCRVLDIEAIGDIGDAFAMDVPSPDNLADLVGSVGRTSGFDPKQKCNLPPLRANGQKCWLGT